MTEQLGLITFRSTGPLTEGQTYALSSLLSTILRTDDRAELTIQHATLDGQSVVALVVMRHDLAHDDDEIGLPVALLLDMDLMVALGDRLQPPEGAHPEAGLAPPLNGVEVYGVPMD